MLADRDRIQEHNGRKITGPERPKNGVRPQAQINLTDPESRIMPSSEGFVQAYNGRAAVDTDSMLIARRRRRALMKVPETSQEGCVLRVALRVRHRLQSRRCAPANRGS